MLWYLQTKTFRFNCNSSQPAETQHPKNTDFQQKVPERKQTQVFNSDFGFSQFIEYVVLEIEFDIYS